MKPINFLLLFITYGILGVSQSIAQCDTLRADIKKDLQEEAMQMVVDLNAHIMIIADGNKPNRQRQDAIRLASSLFWSPESCNFQTKVGNKIFDYTVAEYLNMIRRNQYQNIKILWSKPAYINDFRKGRDRNCEATIKVEQKFMAKRKDGGYEEIIVEKTIVIILTQIEIEQGSTQKRWAVKLCNVLIHNPQEYGR